MNNLAFNGITSGESIPLSRFSGAQALVDQLLKDTLQPDTTKGVMMKYGRSKVVHYPVKFTANATEGKVIKLAIVVDELDNSLAAFTTDTQTTGNGYEVLVRSTCHQKLGQTNDTHIMFDQNMNVINQQLFLGAGANDEHKSCIDKCMDEAGLNIGFFAMACLIAAIGFAAGTGGLGTPVVVACLSASAGVGFSMAKLANCLENCIEP